MGNSPENLLEVLFWACDIIQQTYIVVKPKSSVDRGDMLRLYVQTYAQRRHLDDGERKLLGPLVATSVPPVAICRDWLLLAYGKSVQDDIRGHVPRQVKEETQNG